MKKVAIIGSGLSGLLCGNLLAKKGHNVTIFESHVRPGGYTAGFWREGFYFESGTLALENTPSVNKAMEDIGLKDKVEFVRQRMRFVGREYDYIPEKYYTAHHAVKPPVTVEIPKFKDVTKPIKVTHSDDLPVKYQNTMRRLRKAFCSGTKEEQCARRCGEQVVLRVNTPDKLTDSGPGWVLDVLERQRVLDRGQDLRGPHVL